MTTREIAGKAIEFDEEGFMTNPNDWTEAIANELAHEEGLETLTPNHWLVINFSRSDFKANGEPPGLRRITKAGGVSTKEIYSLFPKGPAKKVARIAGLGKPHGCI